MDENRTGELSKKLIDFAGSDRYKPLFEKALRRLSYDQVATELSDVQAINQRGGCRHPGKLLVHFLKRAIALHGVKPDLKKPKLKKSRYLPDIATWVKELPDHEPGKIQIMQMEESEKRYLYGDSFTAPTPVIMGPEFSVPTGYKIPKDERGKRRDTVMVPYRTAMGIVQQVPLIRGAAQPNDSEEWDVLDSDDTGILEACSEIWRMQGCPVLTDRGSGFALAYCTFDVNTLAALLGYKTTGRSIGSSRRKLASKVTALKKVAYYIDLKGISDIGTIKKKFQTLSFVGDAEIIGAQVGGRGYRLGIRMVFSAFYSQELLQERCVSRSLELIRVREPIAKKITQWLQRLPRSGDKIRPFSFSEVIKYASLPHAKWHDIKSQRYRIINRAIDRVNGKAVSKGVVFDLRVARKKDDAYLGVHFFHSKHLNGASREEREIEARALHDKKKLAFYGTPGQHITHSQLSSLCRLHADAPFRPDPN